MVVKPSELAPASSELMAKLIPSYLDSEAVKVFLNFFCISICLDIQIGLPLLKYLPYLEYSESICKNLPRWSQEG